MKAEWPGVASSTWGNAWWSLPQDSSYKLLRGDATGLSRWRFTVAATQPELLGPKMPRACPVEIHACCYTSSSCWAQRCRGLVPWRITLAATQARGIFGPNNSGLCSSKRDSPRDKPVASSEFSRSLCSWWIPPTAVLGFGTVLL